MAASEYHAGQEPGSVTVRENLTERPVNRRLFMMGSVAIASALVAPAAAAYPSMTAEDDAVMRDAIAKAGEIARLPSVMKYLDDHGAVFAAVAGHPGWYEARWFDLDISDERRHWSASVDINDLDWIYARSFRARVEGIENF